MKKIRCPYCGKELINLSVNGGNEFWCDDCYVEYTIEETIVEVDGISKEELIENCIADIDNMVDKGMIRDKWDCICFAKGYCTRNGEIPIPIINHILNLRIEIR